MTNKIKLIFLDIDGVFNSIQWYTVRPLKGAVRDITEFDPKTVELFNKIIDATNAKIVISSSWRILSTNEYLKDIFKKVGIKGEIIGRTPRLRGQGFDCPRGKEIEVYLRKKHNYPIWDWHIEEGKTTNIENYIILDDDSDMMYYQKDNFVQTSNEVGLTQEDVDKAIKILNKEI